MNAPTFLSAVAAKTLPSGTPSRSAEQASERDYLLTLAHAVLAGDYSGLPSITESERYNLDQWHKEAQATVDGDGRDFARMIAREEAHQLFHADIRAGYRDEFDSFDDFVALSPMRVTAGMVS